MFELLDIQMHTEMLPTNLSTACENATLFSTLLDKSKIGLGECVVLGNAAVSDGVLDLSSGLNIIGKLLIDDDALEPVTITTPFIIVQCELEVKSNQTMISITNEFLKIKLTGDTDVVVTPESANSGVCEGGSCNFGKRPILVAGGKLAINAIPNCPTWFRSQQQSGINIW